MESGAGEEGIPSFPYNKTAIKGKCPVGGTDARGVDRHDSRHGLYTLLDYEPASEIARLEQDLFEAAREVRGSNRMFRDPALHGFGIAFVEILDRRRDATIPEGSSQAPEPIRGPL